MVVLKMIILVLSLGMDTLMMSISLGVIKTTGKVRIAITFACAEAFMPLVGLLIGKGVGQLIGDWASLIGGIALLCVAIWIAFFEYEDEVNEDKFQQSLIGWALMITALSISLDEFAVGFSIGLIGVPVALTIFLVALQAFAFTIFGLTFGSRLKRYLGEWAEKFAGIVIGLLGVWILIDSILNFLKK